MSQETRIEKDEWSVPAVDAAGKRTLSTRRSLAPSPRYEEPYGQRLGGRDNRRGRSVPWL
ncbi:hypothetical protein AUI06_12250 [archaeon 13_2_20CM_2_52_21]|nr:MAG: hypothetical protein AUI06_12250 [archaeon 13_2_20CM_2_52_21]